ncbi:RNA polymerase subunit sigma-70 [Subtercola sp. Z020]|uniref:sigma-70 family RNA polymerase sigma factor n=1 Tax=Subtercola sp. Z020 TaxID=2080582 RepID=UPI000CE90886|nr:sigma-70 family RNA polymerase sigma factor [Subtercola sp. Z020]PPF79067.1 RNA polymerase subunit sigma-70 [Subtercola sp. Z020]
MEHSEAFEIERPRLTNIAARLLADRSEAEDIVQNAWLRLERVPVDVVSLPAWLTTVTTRLCLDRLRARIPVPSDPSVAASERRGSDIAPELPDPADSVERAEAVGQALHVVVETLTPDERVAFVLADTFGFDFASIASILGRHEAAARQLASRARRKVAEHDRDGRVTDWQIVDAFMAAARGGDLERLLELLAPNASIAADAAAVLAGTPAGITGRDAVAAFFNGSARSALPVFIDDRAGSAWFLRGVAKVVFDFEIVDGRVSSVVFRASPDALAAVTVRKGGAAVGDGGASLSHL